jgi:hypothetical protein
MNTIKKQNKLKLTLNFFASLRAILKNKIDTYILSKFKIVRVCVVFVLY